MKPVLALDIETPHREPISNPWLDDITMCGFWDGEKYFCTRTPEDFQTKLDQYPDHDIVGHNTLFDLKFLDIRGWIRKDQMNRTFHDTKIIGALTRDRVPKAFLEQYEVMRKEQNKSLPKGISHREGSPLSLKVMAPWYLKVPPFWETPGNHDNEEYNQADCMYTYRLYQLLSKRLQAEGSWDFYINRMLSWSEMVRAMEARGILLNEAELDKTEKEYFEKRDHLKNKLDEIWGEAHKAYRNLQISALSEEYGIMRDRMIEKSDRSEPKVIKLFSRYQALFDKAITQLEPFNYASPAQMAWLLKDFLGLDITDFEGEESTGKAVLNKLAAEGREDIKTFLEWREADKVLTMYIPTYRSLHIDGIIHPSFNLTGTRTGRTSSSGPNLQQVPPKLYRFFMPRQGHVFVQYDLSGIEAALIALYSGDKRLYAILEQKESIHDHNAKAMFDLECPIPEVSSKHPKERRVVKNIGFACFYGAGWRRISQVFAAGGFPISDQEAKKKLALLKSYYPQVFAYHKEITEVFESGETVRNLFGRPITIQPHENKYMTGFNTLIQSSASDLNLRACERFWKTGKSPLLVIHDCIIAESRKEDAERDARLLTQYMTDYKLESINGPIQLQVEGSISERWEK